MPSPVGHMMAGLIIGAVPTKNLKKLDIKRLLLGAFVAAAPDLDMLLVFAGVDYIYAHRTFSHSIVMAFMVFLLLWALNYVLSFRREKYSIPYLLITVCLLTHIGLDMLCIDTYGPKGLMIFWPFSTKFFYTDTNIFHGLFFNGQNLMSIKTVMPVLIRETTIIGLVGIIILSVARYYVCHSNKCSNGDSP